MKSTIRNPQFAIPAALALLLIATTWLWAPPAWAGRKSWQTPQFALNDLAANMALPGDASTQDSAATTAQTITIAAPGLGKYLHFRGVLAEGSASTVTGTLKFGITTKLVTYVGAGNARLALTGVDIRGPENTVMTFDLAAPGSGTTRATVFYSIEDTTEGS